MTRRRRVGVSLAVVAACGAGVVFQQSGSSIPNERGPGKASCGIERWAVKTGQDPAAANVDLTPQASSVAQLRAIPKQRDGLARQPAETRTYTVTASLVLEKLEADSDWHLVLRDGGLTMIAEIPDPACMGRSPWRGQVGQVRSMFSQVRVGRQVTVTGVLFLDRVHGQAGVASNGAELHPVLELR